MHEYMVSKQNNTNFNVIMWWRYLKKYLQDTTHWIQYPHDYKYSLRDINLLFCNADPFSLYWDYVNEAQNNVEEAGKEIHKIWVIAEWYCL